MKVFLPFVIICLLISAALWGDEKSTLRFIVRQNHPRDSEKPAPSPPDLITTNELTLAGEGLMRLYQTFVSPMDAPSCPFTPTCSEYARLAIAKYGLISGLVMAVDRYQRCNGLGTRFYPREQDTHRLLDPP